MFRAGSGSAWGGGDPKVDIDEWILYCTKKDVMSQNRGGDAGKGWSAYSTCLYLDIHLCSMTKVKTQNLLEMMEKVDWPGREFSRWRRRGKIPTRGSTPIQPLRKWSKHRTDLETTKIEVSWFFHFITSAETDDKLSHTLRSTLKVGFGQARACHLVLNPLHLKKLNFRKKSNIFTLTQLAALKLSNPKRSL